MNPTCNPTIRRRNRGVGTVAHIELLHSRAASEWCSARRLTQISSFLFCSACFVLRKSVVFLKFRNHLGIPSVVWFFFFFFLLSCLSMNNLSIVERSIVGKVYIQGLFTASLGQCNHSKSSAATHASYGLHALTCCHNQCSFIKQSETICKQESHNNLGARPKLGSSENDPLLGERSSIIALHPMMPTITTTASWLVPRSVHFTHLHPRRPDNASRQSLDAVQA